MFNNKDYCSYTHGLMMATVLFGYNSVFEYSKKLGITWVSVASLRLRDLHKSPPLTPDPDVLYLTFFCLILAQGITLKRCLTRIQSGELDRDHGIKSWFKSLLEYFTAFICALIFLPLFFKLLRGW